MEKKKSKNLFLFFKYFQTSLSQTVEANGMESNGSINGRRTEIHRISLSFARPASSQQFDFYNPPEISAESCKCYNADVFGGSSGAPCQVFLSSRLIRLIVISSKKTQNYCCWCLRCCRAFCNVWSFSFENDCAWRIRVVPAAVAIQWLVQYDQQKG